jgi:glycosyltransferase involved in cell wall biosynthesis
MVPKVSIIIPVYNGSNYLREAIDSALAQTYLNIEILVINDGSDDMGQTETIAKSYGDQIRYYLKPNGGVASALNMGIDRMDGEYFSWLSHDDIYMPEKVANEVKALTGVKDKTTIIAEGYQVIDSTSKSLYPVNLHTLYPKSKLHDGLFVLLRGGINGCCMLIHKSHFSKFGGFDPALPTTQDYDLFFKMLRDQKIVYLETCNMLSRAHEAQGSKANIEAHILECDRLWIGMMQKLTDEERIRLDGSVYGFYANLYKFLRDLTGYSVAIQYAYKMMRVSGAEEYKRNRTDDCLEKLSKVSIIIPVYNGSNYLREAIDSALAQTYPNIEILVINDGSDDMGQTETIAKSYGDQIQYYSKLNGGVASALNMGIDRMDGEFFSWLSHDDIYKPEKVAREIDFLMQFKNSNFVVFSSYSVIDGFGNVLDKNHSIPQHIAENVECLLALDTENTLNGCTTLIPIDLIKSVGKFREDLRFTQDYDFWDRLNHIAEFVYLDEPLLLSRRHEKQSSQTGGERCLYEADNLHFRLINQLRIESVGRYLHGVTNKLIVIEQIYNHSGYIKTTLAIKKLSLRYSRYISDEINVKRIIKSFGIFSYDQLLSSSLFCKKDRHIITVYSNVWMKGGIERVCSLLFERFHSEYQIVLISNDIPSEDGYPLPNGLLHIKISPQQNISDQLAALSYLIDTDIFIGNPNINIDVLLVYEKLKQLNVKSIMLNHYNYLLPYQYPYLSNILDARQRAMDDCTITLWVSSFSAAMCATRHPNVGVLANANTFTGKKERTAYDRSVIIVGRFYDYIKRIDRSLEVFRHVFQIEPTIRFMVIGGYNPEMHCPDMGGKTVAELIDELPFPDGTLTFVGECDETQLSYHYSQAGVLLLSSDSEGFPLVLNEAAVHGVPAVVFEILGLEDIIVNGENGYIVEQNDYRGAAEVIVSLLNDSKKWFLLSKKSQLLAERFSRDIIMKRWEALFSALLQNPLPNIRDLIRDIGLSPVKLILNSVLGKVAEKYESSAIANENYYNSTHSLYSADENHNNCTYLLYSSNSWRITKPIRAFQNARKYERGLGRRIRYCWSYMKDSARDIQTDAEIHRSHCWRITAPLRKIARPFKKNR